MSPEFRIDLHSRDLFLIRKIQSFFGVGTINQYESKNSVVYSVQSLRDIINVIIPHFDKYPLITQKKADYLRACLFFPFLFTRFTPNPCITAGGLKLKRKGKIFKQGIELLNLKARSDIEGIRKIVSIKASMNWGLSRLCLLSSTKKVIH